MVILYAKEMKFLSYLTRVRWFRSFIPGRMEYPKSKKIQNKQAVSENLFHVFSFR